MKLRDTFELMEMDDQIVAVPIGNTKDGLNGIIKMNKSAVAIFELLKEDTSEDAIVDSLLRKYDTDRITIERYVRKYISELKEANLLI